MKRYSSYICCILESLQEKGVTVKSLSFYLLTLSAFNHEKQKPMLLSAHEAELENAVDLRDIFKLLTTQYASFLNYGIFQMIADKYQIENGENRQVELNYPDHLETYVKKLKASEFVKINPLLEKTISASKKLVLKIDIELTSELSKVLKLKSAIAKILGIKSSALKLLDIKKGCVTTIFLLPTPVAEFIFNTHTVFSMELREEFHALRVVWLECNGFRFDFRFNFQQQEYFDDDSTMRSLRYLHLIYTVSIPCLPPPPPKVPMS